jgi:thioredoxin-dependent peroxiredoxin
VLAVRKPEDANGGLTDGRGGRLYRGRDAAYDSRFLARLQRARNDKSCFGAACQSLVVVFMLISSLERSVMKSFSVLLLTLVVAALSAVAADQAQPPVAGTQAPAFSLPNQEGTQVSLDQFKGKWVVLYFYPKDFTSGCTIEAHNFQRDIDKYTAMNAVIVGVSVDDVDSHKGFCAKEGLNFKLLADSSHVVVKEYGSTMEYNGMTLASRNTFLIDPAGVIRKVYVKVSPQGHSEEVLADLQQLQSAK